MLRSTEEISVAFGKAAAHRTKLYDNNDIVKQKVLGGNFVSVGGESFDLLAISNPHVFTILSLFKGQLMFNGKDIEIKRDCEIVKVQDCSVKSAKTQKFKKNMKRKLGLGGTTDFCKWTFDREGENGTGVVRSDLGINKHAVGSIFSQICNFQNNTARVSEFNYSNTITAIARKDSYLTLLVKGVLYLHQINMAYSANTGIKSTLPMSSYIHGNRSDIEQLCGEYDVLINADILSDDELNMAALLMDSYPIMQNKVDTVYNNIVMDAECGVILYGIDGGTKRNIKKALSTPELFWRNLFSFAHRLCALDELALAFDVVRGRCYLSEQMIMMAGTNVSMSMDLQRSHGIITILNQTDFYSCPSLVPCTNLMACSAMLVVDMIIGTEMCNVLHYTVETVGAGNTSLWTTNSASAYRGLLKDKGWAVYSYENVFCRFINERCGGDIKFEVGKIYSNGMGNYGYKLNKNKHNPLAISDVVNDYRVDNIFSYLFGRSGRLDSTTHFESSVKIGAALHSASLNSIAESNKSTNWFRAHGIDKERHNFGGLLNLGLKGIDENGIDLINTTSNLLGVYQMSYTIISVTNTVGRQSYETITEDSGFWTRYYLGGNSVFVSGVSIEDILAGIDTREIELKDKPKKTNNLDERKVPQLPAKNTKLPDFVGGILEKSNDSLSLDTRFEVGLDEFDLYIGTATSYKNKCGADSLSQCFRDQGIDVSMEEVINSIRDGSVKKNGYLDAGGDELAYIALTLGKGLLVVSELGDGKMHITKYGDDTDNRPLVLYNKNYHYEPLLYRPDPRSKKLRGVRKTSLEVIDDDIEKVLFKSDNISAALKLRIPIGGVYRDRCKDITGYEFAEYIRRVSEGQFDWL